MGDILVGLLHTANKDRKNWQEKKAPALRRFQSILALQASVTIVPAVGDFSYEQVLLGIVIY